MATSNHKKQYTTLSDIDHVLLRPEVIFDRLNWNII